MPEKIFIIGNGFDLDLNFRTRYSDYFEIWKENHHWPFNDSSKGLGGYIHKCAKKDKKKWLDLEMALFEYASAHDGAAIKGMNGSYPIDTDKEDFDILVGNLTSFIKRIPSEDQINKDSVASKVLRTILDNGSYAIYSFNYTNLKNIAARLYLDVSYYGAEYDLSYTSVHGTVEDNNIILGVHSDANLIEGYDFLKKIDQTSYQSNDFLQDISGAREVVFFGLSMGIIDYPYFRLFFNALCSRIVPLDKKKHVTIFTYNESSRLEIYEQLRQLTGTDLMSLKSNCYFEIIRTSLCKYDDKDKFEKWISRQRL